MSDVRDLSSDSVVYKTLLESTKAIPWKIDWATMKFAYIGPQIESLIGFMFDITERKKTEEKLLALRKELEALSFKDGLTNIANRRRFDTNLELEWETARSNGLPLSILMFDIDYFKQYNDLYGHIPGDQCLTDIAQTLSLALDGTRDLVARFGGEEFVVLLPEADGAVALKVAERCQRLIEKKSIVHAQSPHGHRLTFSIGVGTTIPGSGMAPSAFIEAVDQQLYTAKNNGRNRIESVQVAV